MNQTWWSSRGQFDFYFTLWPHTCTVCVFIGPIKSFNDIQNVIKPFVSVTPQELLLYFLLSSLCCCSSDSYKEIKVKPPVKPEKMNQREASLKCRGNGALTCTLGPRGPRQERERAKAWNTDLQHGVADKQHPRLIGCGPGWSGQRLMERLGHNYSFNSALMRWHGNQDLSLMSLSI